MKNLKFVVDIPRIAWYIIYNNKTHKKGEKKMREYAKEQIIEQYGKEALAKIEQADYTGNVLLVYADDYVFEVIGGVLTNHSMSVDDILDLLDIDMDEYAQENDWEDWDFGALKMLDVA